MKAVVYDRYGSPDVLRLTAVDPPAPGEGEVLVRVRATSINSWDWGLLAGTFQGRLGFNAWRTPKFKTLGADVAGHIEAVGPNVADFQVGDEVYGDTSANGFGGLAQYVAAPASALAAKSPQMTFEQAAATPQAGLLALQALRDKPPIRPGQRILVNGAGGGVGTFAVQIAHSAGAKVTGVDHAAKLEMVRAIGAEHVIDYTQHDFTRTGCQYDVIIDVVATRPMRAYRRALRPHGIAVIVGGSMRTILASLALGRMPTTGGRRISLLMYQPTPAGLTDLTQLFEDGHVAPVIESSYPLSDTAQAFARFGQGQVTGKLVITLP